MELSDLLRICRSFAKLGVMITNQIEDAANGNFDDTNPNALRIIKTEFLEPMLKGRENEDWCDEVEELIEAIEHHLKTEQQIEVSNELKRRG